MTEEILKLADSLEWKTDKNFPKDVGLLVKVGRNQRIVKAVHFSKYTQEADTQGDWYEYEEKTDTYWCPEGWYEDIYSETGLDYGYIFLHDEITHYMPLPDGNAGAVIRELVAERDAYKSRSELWYKHAEDLQRELREAYTILAPKLGLKPFYSKANKEQIIWAESQEQADSLLIGGNIYTFIKQALTRANERAGGEG